jgi:hypothetical protein
MLNFPSFFNGVSAPYEIEQSLRFDGSSKLSRTNGSGGNLRTFTQSFWVKRTGTTTDVIFEAWGDTNNWATTAFATGLLSQNRVSGTTYGINTANVGISYRDFGAWYHVVISYSNAVPTLYVNGSEVSTPNNNSSDWHFLRNGYPLTIGARSTNEEFLDGYLSEIHFVDGTALAATDFGEFNADGVWVPKEVSGLTYGTNGFYLKFDPSATNGIGHDHSGNGNNFTPTGFTTSGTGTDVMSDTPTTNWATLNAVDPVAVTFSEGNLKAAGPNDWQTARSTIAMTSGKWYWEVTPTFPSGQYVIIGVVNKDANLTSFVGSDANGWGFETYTPALYNNNAYTSYGTAPASGTVLGFAFDADTGKMWIRNASGFFTGDPAAGTTPAMTAGAGEWYPAVSCYPTNVSNTCNFGQRAFAYTPPTGFNALNTANLPAPDIADGSDYFNTVLYTGNATVRSITGVGFEPDLVWIKDRSGAYNHGLFDAVRGANLRLSSSTTGAEITYTQSLTAFDSDGFSLGDNSDSNNTVNINNNTYVAWNWLAGGSGSSNTDGSITSTVSANPSAGFSIVSYTGTGANATVGHGLGVAPSMIIVKNRDRNAAWAIYHASIGATKVLQFDTNSVFTDSTSWNNTSPTSSVFTIGTANSVNASTEDLIAYCFAEVEGYSKFGSYIGNGSNDGPFVFLNFRPALILTKRTNSTSNWVIQDSTRQTYNPSDAWLRPNTADAEGTTSPDLDLDFLSNGFKVRNNGTDNNISGSTYIFMALAEHPFGGDGVSPATAR